MTRPHLRSLAAILSLTTPAAVTLVACSLNRPQMYLASAGPVASAPPAAQEVDGHDTESYDRIDENPFLAARDNPLSTFSIDVDTASYANVRRFLNEQLPPHDAVRIEELVNYFHYAYPPPDGERAAAHHAPRSAACPWNADHRSGAHRRCARATCDGAARRRATSSSWSTSRARWTGRTSCRWSSARCAAGRAAAASRIASRIVVYAGTAGLVLPLDARAATSGASSPRSTASRRAARPTAAQGIELAYDVARAELHQRRHQPRDPRHRRRLQRRRQQPGRARCA